MLSSTGYGVTNAHEPLSQLDFTRRDLRADDVQIDILYCGVCHSDLHTARNEWGNTVYPVVPGHEIIGRVAAVGGQVRRFKKGNLVGVGCMVDSCQHCSACAEGLEQYCENGFVGTYNGEEMHSGGMTYGGYANNIVVRDKFVLSIPDNLDPASAAPLLCAGITTWSPLRQWQVGPGKKVGIVGLGGLGHMGIKLAHAMGAQVVLFTTSPEKREDATRLGADEAVVSRNASEMEAHRNSFDFILDTVAAPHPLDPFIELLKRDGTMTLVGAPASPHPSPQVFNLIMKRRRLAGSLIGGIAETQEMLDFCGERGIISDIEMIRIQDINTAYERMLKGDVKYRFVIDMASLKQRA
ncbi:MAG TPA: NAD(P)-dependent alcohol dehydrogenase [Noviherbaspirillum sp.]|uniref:NAD(P)-dependent alcohol dehydrogenase n=1 Tax=Noviherbaspirillum sp. TaxID=1926288 RepID=UPI002B4A82C5|nr:NAD(P)-dependent alcohol dehydrogenase [Noviherbaspirillum sp.]HJV84672.1 NAD(P)-dependent alcohol dehydrogenase [Noviherbaspirillum sp.]